MTVGKRDAGVFAYPMAYSVKKTGAVLRVELELGSDEICVLAGGTTVLCDRSERLVDGAKGRMRMHATEPSVGWLSAKCLALDGGTPRRDRLAPSRSRYAALEARVTAAGGAMVRRRGETWWVVRAAWCAVLDAPNADGKTLGFVERGAAVVGEAMGGSSAAPGSGEWIRLNDAERRRWFFDPRRELLPGSAWLYVGSRERVPAADDPMTVPPDVNAPPPPPVREATAAEAKALEGGVGLHPDRRTSAADVLPFRLTDPAESARDRFAFTPSARGEWGWPLGQAIGGFNEADVSYVSCDTSEAASQIGSELWNVDKAARHWLDAPAPGCWLIPTVGGASIAIAKQKARLEEAGWRLLTCAPEIIEELDNKCRLRERAERLGAAAHLPEHYTSLATAAYPCVVKLPTGEYGKAVRLARTSADLPKIVDEFCLDPAKCGEDWLVQEFVPGCLELSTSLLVRNGHIEDVIRTAYTYNIPVYVWPHGVWERKECRVVDSIVSERDLDVFRTLVAGFSGICNFNYKHRENGELVIFECNVRLGADLACDVDRERFRLVLERLDGALPIAPCFEAP